MRLPRIIIGTSTFIRLWQNERRENARLKRELTGWQNLVLQKANLPQLHQAPVVVEQRRQPPIGPTAKAAYLKEEQSSAIPTAEDILNNPRRNGR
jgi:hypothetical protein